MSVADEAFNEAKRRVEMMPLGDETDVHFAAGFIEGAEWQASRKVEVTDEMVEKAAAAIYEQTLRQEGTSVGFVSGNQYAQARAALVAALGGHTKGESDT